MTSFDVYTHVNDPQIFLVWLSIKYTVYIVFQWLLFSGFLKPNQVAKYLKPDFVEPDLQMFIFHNNPKILFDLQETKWLAP